MDELKQELADDLGVTATALLWTAAGKPHMEGILPGRCRTCGYHSKGMSFDAWVRSTFTDWDKLTAGEIICPACQFAFTDQNETLARVLGKDQPQRTRNYSHFVLSGEWIPLSKGDKARMREILFQSPDLAVIATSGQKHILFRSKPGWWQIEENSTRPFPAALEQALAPVESLYQGGFSKSEIATGRYSQHRILAFGVATWNALETKVRRLRGTPALDLALFLAQKADNDESGDRGPPVMAGLEGNPGRVQAAVRTKHLGAVRK